MNLQNQSQFSDETYLNMDLLRFTTAGSVDDGKSTLIGRLLFDSKSIFEDQMDAIELTSRNTGEDGVNLALLTDGLKAEREQKITIDVAYRYFATPNRKFIIADTPGHEQYTRNMVTGASTADLAIILVDAKNGLTSQSKRHAFIASLLQIPHVVVAVNKMDLVDYSEERFRKIREEFDEISQKLDVDDISFIPISALNGDNIVNKSESMPWYQGATLLHTLENVNIGSRKNLIDFRFPVQYVIRPNQNFRGFAGTISSGTIKVGEEVMALPSMTKSRVKEIWAHEDRLEEAFAGHSVTLTIEDELDISRGDMLVRSKNLPSIEREFEAQLCWMHEQPMIPGKTYALMHTTRTVQVIPRKLRYKIDVNTFHRQDADKLELNEIGRVKFTTSQPLFIDPYKINNETGSFIVIDPATKVTVGAGMIRAITARDNEDNQTEPKALHVLEELSDVKWEPWNIPREVREKRNGHQAKVIWLTGISGACISTLAKAMEQKLWNEGKQTVLLDGDKISHGLCGDLGFSSEDRTENIRWICELARVLFDLGYIVLCTFISPYKLDRDWVHKLFPDYRFIEVNVVCNPKTAEVSDSKTLYAKIKKGEIEDLTRFDKDYEQSDKIELTINSDEQNVENAIKAIFNRI